MAAFRLPKLPVNWKEQPQLFERYWDEMTRALESAFNTILAVPVIQAAVAAAQASATSAQGSATAATVSAASAQSAADAQAIETSLVNSFTSGFTAPLVSVTAAGVITIKAHQRVYANSTLNPTVSISSGSIATGLAPGSTIRIYYNDNTKAGGAVTYLYTVDPATPPVQGGIVHSVGAVTVPGVGTFDGKTIFPAGYVFL